MADILRPEDIGPDYPERLDPERLPTALRDAARRLKAKLLADPEFCRRWLIERRRSLSLYHTFGEELIAHPPEAVRAKLHAARN